MSYVNFFRNGNGGHMSFVRDGDQATQFHNGRVIGHFTRDGDTWTSRNGERSMKTINPNGIIASGLTDGGTISGGRSHWERVSGHSRPDA